ncbi:UDP-N-acetylmuramoylalanine--D-glutamate ligase [Halopolyspora algeriensis]|uniref:UDP-N-acetylmuramoylalanine--D-glutamate ligase n=1 Tax=Halopolyspora algeriensis TaxID=1500506 RepID=A0A368VP50_9ACTN|nr:UDP-N-acetylmuramoyl-L-alanine--D-glutamate ligase [Halopolyspora algeriensis]RCW43274.1 UDP-N-acetylmuramoylalanine--D-glutamate ligase [Halopolyspora algeriensis]TQM56333.1 UDP-N-acetylmuramoylalanine--D-glutamate ligase [Halopolyspora algeriensis]
MRRRVLVAGAGVSGRSAAEALLARGDAVTITDASADRLAALASLQSQGADLVAGLTAPPPGTDLVVTSPGWRPDAPLPAAAAEAGIEVIGEIELAWCLDRQSPEPATWLAVTGTNGKTTTVGMLASILRSAGADAVACGNVGLPAVDAVRAGHRVLAVELSSFQLHWSDTLAPHAAVVLNLADDHLDWHGSLAAYGAAKGKIYDHTTVAVFNADDAWSVHLADAARSPRRIGCTASPPEPGQIGLADGRLLDRSDCAGADAADGVVLASLADVHPPGPHNAANALAAAALARSRGVAPDAVAEGLRTFEPGSHRSVLVAESAGVGYVDDSKATNPHAAAAALGAHPRVVWIAGGLLKGADVDALVASHADRLDAAVLIGQDRDRFAAALARHAPDVPVREVEGGEDSAMLEAVHLAAGFAQPGSAVVLAPAAASMDMFTDYAHRGQAFADAVRIVLSRHEAVESAGEQGGW